MLTTATQELRKGTDRALAIREFYSRHPLEIFVGNLFEKYERENENRQFPSQTWKKVYSRKEHTKFNLVKLHSLVAKCCKMWKILYSLTKFANFVYLQNFQILQDYNYFPPFTTFRNQTLQFY